MSGRRWAARAWWLAGLVVLAVAMVGVPALGASAPGDGGVRADGDSGPLSDRVLRDAERSVAEARLKRDAADSAAGRAERAASAAKYGDLSGAEALAVDRRELGEVFAVRPWDPLGSVSGERVQRLNDFSALLDVGDGRKRLLEANLPVSVLQGGRRVPVSLMLEDRGDTHAPESPATPYDVADDPGRGVNLSDAGVRVGSDLGSGSGAEVVNGRVFSANVAPSTDLTVLPLPAGVEESLIVRSRDGPERWVLHVAAKQADRVEPGADSSVAARVVRDREVGDPRTGKPRAEARTVAEFGAPAAWDAQGRPVEVSARLDGTDVVLSFAHRDRDVAYPLVVDPTITQTFGSANPAHPDFANWLYQTGFFSPATQLPPAGGFTSATSGAWGPGLYSSSNAGSFQFGQYAWWYYTAYGSQFITRAQFGSLTTRDLKAMTDEAARRGAFRPNTQGRPGHIFEHAYPHTIGTSRAGEPTSRLRVIVDNDGRVVTAFPY